jgi:hypothetical protein
MKDMVRIPALVPGLEAFLKSHISDDQGWCPNISLSIPCVGGDSDPVQVPLAACYPMTLNEPLLRLQPGGYPHHRGVSHNSTNSLIGGWYSIAV